MMERLSDIAGTDRLFLYIGYLPDRGYDIFPGDVTVLHVKDSISKSEAQRM